MVLEAWVAHAYTHTNTTCVFDLDLLTTRSIVAVSPCGCLHDASLLVSKQSLGIVLERESIFVGEQQQPNGNDNKGSTMVLGRGAERWPCYYYVDEIVYCVTTYLNI